MTEAKRWCAAVANRAMGLPTPWRQSLLLAWDCLSWVIAAFVFILVRYDLSLNTTQWSSIGIYLAVALMLQVGLGLATHVYLGRNRVGSFDDLTWTGLVVALAGFPVALLMRAWMPDFPRGVAILLPPLALLLMATARWAFRVFNGSRAWAREDDGTTKVPTLIYGAGDAGHQLAQLIHISDGARYDIVGFIDDNLTKRFLRVHGHRIVGTGERLAEVAEELGAEKVIFAISHATPAKLQEVARTCQEAGLKFEVLPPLHQMIGGRVSLSAIREFNVNDLLGRRPITTDLDSVKSYIAGKVVLVTGAGGSIGSELARQVHTLGPAKLLLLDRDESLLHAAQLSIYGNGLLDTDDVVLCDIRDREALEAVFERQRPEVVFHAAALKHLPLLERFPDEGWKTNVHGSLNVLRCAQAVGVAHFVNVSTDKAADATCVLGHTKRIAERLTAWYARAHDLPYVSVRFGNVLGSRGSVLHSFRTQIEQGGPVTVTDPEVTRYFMTIPEACQLVIQAGAIGNPGDVLVLDMGEPVRIVDVAERLIAESGKQVEIRFTGLRPGEKMHEVLFSDLEEGATSIHPLISQVHVDPLEPRVLPARRPDDADVQALLGQRDRADRLNGAAVEAEYAR